MKIYVFVDITVYCDLFIETDIFDIHELCKQSSLTHFRPMPPWNSRAYSIMWHSHIVFHMLQIKGNISLILVKES